MKQINFKLYYDESYDGFLHVLTEKMKELFKVNKIEDINSDGLIEMTTSFAYPFILYNLKIIE